MNGHKHLVIIVIVYLVQHCSCQSRYAVKRYNDTKVTYIYDESITNNDDIERIFLFGTAYKVAKGTFRNLTLLRDIEISEASVHEIEPGFSELTPKLKIFYALKNQIQTIKAGVFNTLNLSVLDISSNRILHIDDGAFSNMNLTYLCLSDNKLTTINSTWFHNTTITALAITHNQISSLMSNTFDGLVKIITLKLDFNKIHYIEENTFSKQCCLTKLYLSGNSLTNITFALTDKLKKLDVSLNMINSILLQNANALIVIYIYPNPWACKCLLQFWKQLNEEGIYIGDTHSLKVPWKDEYPLCIAVDIQCNTDDLIIDKFMYANYYNRINFTYYGKYVYRKQDDFVDLGDYIYWLRSSKH